MGKHGCRRDALTMNAQGIINGVLDLQETHARGSFSASKDGSERAGVGGRALLTFLN
jgi:hypothetical protein